MMYDCMGIITAIIGLHEVNLVLIKVLCLDDR